MLAGHQAKICRHDTAFAVVLALSFAVLGTIPYAIAQDQSRPEAFEFAKPITQRLNATGQTIPIDVDVQDDGQSLGSTTLFIDPDDSLSVPAAAILTKLEPVVDSATLQTLRKIQPVHGRVALAEVRRAGIDVRYDPALFALIMSTNAAQRAQGITSIARRTTRVASVDALPVSGFSAWMNIYAGLDYRWGVGGQAAALSGRLDLEQRVRIGSFVFENDLLYDGLVDTFNCPTNAVCAYQHEAGWKRRASSMVLDLPASTTRVRLGDTRGAVSGFQRQPDLLGVSIDNRARLFGLGETVRASGTSTFQLDRPSRVSVIVNGQLLLTSEFRAGSHRLQEIPFIAGANEVTLEIVDDQGTQRRLTFVGFFDGGLLKPGKTEWSVAAGLPSYLRDSERHYLNDAGMIATSYLRHGISDTVTGELNAAMDERVRLGGVGLAVLSPFGVFDAQGGISQSDLGVGYAAGLTWTLGNLRSPFAYFGFGAHLNVRVAYDYRSTAFRSPAEYTVLSSGVLTPQTSWSHRLQASMSMPLWEGAAFSVNGRYQLDDPKQIRLSPLQIRGNQWAAGVALSQQLSRTWSLSAVIDWTNERNQVIDTAIDRSNGDVRGMLRLVWHPASRSLVTSSYNTRDREAMVSAMTSTGSGSGSWDANLDIYSRGLDGSASANACVGAAGNRVDTRVCHSGQFADVTPQDLAARTTSQRTSARIGAAVGVVTTDDGRMLAGWGPPQYDAAMMVTRHQTLAAHPVSIGQEHNLNGTLDAWGPLLARGISAYNPLSVPINAKTLPSGYSLGSGLLEAYLPLNGVTVGEIGSSDAVSVTGRILSKDGKPVEMVSGIAYRVNRPDRTFEVFAGTGGKFYAERFGAGVWQIELPGAQAKLRYRVILQPSAAGIVQLGDLRPTGHD